MGASVASLTFLSFSETCSLAGMEYFQREKAEKKARKKEKKVEAPCLGSVCAS